MTSTSSRPHHAFPWRRVIGVSLVMIVLVVGLWSLIRAFGETEIVPSPTVVPTDGAATPTPTADPATPLAPATPDDVDEPSWAVGSLPAMLDLAPDLLADGSLPLHAIARYSDIAGWMVAEEVPTPSSPREAANGPWAAALNALALPASLREFGLESSWRQTYGFDLTQVTQVLEVGQAPDVVLLIRGTFEADALTAAWVASGYQPVEVEGETIWTLAPSDEIDLSAPESRLSLGALNNVVLLEDGTLVASARMTRLGAVLQVQHGDAASLADDASIAPLLEPEIGADLLVSAILARGSMVQAPPGSGPDIGTPVEQPPMATPAGTSEDPLVPVMGEVAVVLAGIGVPIDHSAPFSVALVLDDDDAAPASAAMIEQRLANGVSPLSGRPYSRVLGETMVTVEGEVVMVTAPLPPPAFSWLELVSERDLGFVFWYQAP